MEGKKNIMEYSVNVTDQIKVNIEYFRFVNILGIAGFSVTKF